MNTMRVLQLNCLHSEQEPRVSIITEAIAHASPDLGMLQEVNHYELIADALAAKGYEHTLIKKGIAKNGEPESVLLFSKTPWLAPAEDLAKPDFDSKLIMGVTVVNGVRVQAISTHGPWGGASEGRRLLHNEQIDRLAADKAFHEAAEVTVLGGDLNAEPNSRSMRYLAGKDLDSKGEGSTLWIDGWYCAGSPENEITASPTDNRLSAAVAQMVKGVTPELVPDRRIDYLLTRGWNYGRRGGFLNFGRLVHPAGEELSDHYGLVATIQL